MGNIFSTGDPTTITCTGTVEEVVLDKNFIKYRCKAILSFKHKGQEEKAVLLVHKYTIDSASVDELEGDGLKEGDVLQCYVQRFDHGGFSTGKDWIRFYAFYAWKFGVEARQIGFIGMPFDMFNHPTSNRTIAYYSNN